MKEMADLMEIDLSLFCAFSKDFLSSNKRSSPLKNNSDLRLPEKSFNSWLRLFLGRAQKH